MRLGSRFAEALSTVGFVLGVVTFEEHRLRIVFVRQDVRRDAVKEPPVSYTHLTLPTTPYV